MSDPDASPVSVDNDAAAHRFEARFPDGVAFLKYHTDRAGRLYLDHTEVPPARRHRGVAALLAGAALEFARSRNLRIVPRCPYVIAFLREHPEFASLVESGEVSGIA